MRKVVGMYPRRLQERSSRNAGSEGIALIVVSVVAALAVSALLLLLTYYCFLAHHLNNNNNNKKKKSKNSSKTGLPRLRDAPLPVHQNAVPKISDTEVFTFKQLQAASSNFSQANVSGHGGFGYVYRGVLPTDGSIVAIKQLESTSKQGEHEFRVEVDMLSCLHSPYLVGLRGYCADQDQRLLVYQFMPNGSLQQQLYSNGGTSGSANPPILDWHRRMQIALDSARGLEYLHEHVNPPVIHRDFKSSNVLLDESFNAKVSDFGLAKLGSDKAGGLVSTRVLGTQGYVAPEYAQTGHLTTKSDVYSYGVVLLELLTGRAPIDMKRPPGQGVLVTWALPRLTDREKLVEMIDPVLEGQYAMKELIQVAAIAAMCVQPEADYRPLITDVVQSLIPLVKQKTPNGSESAHLPSSL